MDELDLLRAGRHDAGLPARAGRTLQEVALARVRPAALRALPLGGEDLANLLERFDEQFETAAAIDRAALFEAACKAPATSRGQPLLFLDVPLEATWSSGSRAT